LQLVRDSNETILEVSEIGYLTWWNFPKKAWFIILGELSLIVSLSISLYLTYLNDVYFQSYANNLSPILVPALSVAFGISSASIAVYLYLGIKRIQIGRDAGASIKKKASHPTKDPTETHRDNASTSKSDSQSQLIRGRLRPIAPSASHVRSRPHPKEPDDHTTAPEAKKQP